MYKTQHFDSSALAPGCGWKCWQWLLLESHGGLQLLGQPDITLVGKEWSKESSSKPTGVMMWKQAFRPKGWTVWIAITAPDCTPLAGVVTMRAGPHQGHMSTLHATVAALHSAKTPGKGVYHLKGSWSSNPIPYRVACVATHQGQVMNTWGGISPKYAHLKLKANQIPISHWVNGASRVTQTFRFRYYLEGERNKFRSPPN